ncbi:hypothetical protein CP980_13990 [Streptomyces vinaceus]|uniref:Lipoprotein n=1 Tax=Streptomyces vinaceus TaxID=1960 RepID=A0A5J6JE76_STRVI|nr:hypothetical protein [Streptomyces vinaceus]QEV46066.1 hypothetical protein CP980_13990 [Streptomyces vinaceus]GHE47837.1 hypothetical protein GCM10017778_34620 [Streptomyces vinaceus]
MSANRAAYRRKAAGATLAAVLLVGGATACDNGKKEDSGKAAGAASAQPSAPVAGGSATEALTAAYKKTSAAKSAKVRMTMKMSGGLGGENIEMTGVQGWDPQVMDITMKGGLGQAGVDSMRMVMSKDVMYMEMPADSPMSAGMDGKRWMKLDMKAAAEASGDAEVLKKFGGAGGMGGMSGMDQNQDPAKQLALLLASPNVKLVGSEKVEGADAQHYKGTLTFEEMLAANEGSKALPEADRAKLTEAMKKAGIKGYDMDVWVNKDGYPARMKVAIGTPQGSLDLDASYSDYATTATVQTPPENETLDLFAMLKDLGAGADASGT